MIFKNLLKNKLLYLKFLIFLPFTLLLLFLRIFIKFKISKMQTNIFGHMTTPIELYICKKKNNSLDNNLVWFRDKIVSNDYIYNHWKKKLIILPRHFLEPVYIILSNFNIFNFVIHNHVENRGEQKKILYNQIEDTKNLFKIFPPSIKFKINEIKKAKIYLDRNNIDENKIITFCARSKYPRAAINKKEEFETARNSNINKYLKGLNYLSNKNFKLLRIGKNEKIKLDSENNNVIDFALSEDRNDFLETYLVSKSRFMICSNYGANELAVIFRRKRLMLDFFDFSSIKEQNLFLTPMILPKIFYHLNNNFELTFEEAFIKKLYYIHRIEHLNELGYGLRDNSERQIEQAIINFDMIINNKLDQDKIYNEQIFFWNAVKKYFAYENKYKTILCPSFFDNNNKLFKFV